MAVEIIDLTNSPFSQPRLSKGTRILNFGAASVRKNQSRKASQIASGFQRGMHGQTVQRAFPYGTRLKDHWTQEEHELFLIGLNKCGKGRWSRIARDFLKNKTAQQVQRYAACYFRHFPPSVQDFKPKKAPYSAVNNLMRASSSYSLPMLANKPKQILMLFPEKALSFPVPPYGERTHHTNRAASTSMTSTANGKLDLELRLGRSQ